MKDLSNILLGTQGAQTPSNATSVAANEAKALGQLGELAQNNPELALMLNDQNVDFKAMLEGMSHEEAQALVDSVNNGVNVLEAKQASLAGELNQALQLQPTVQSMLQGGQDATDLNQLQKGMEQAPTQTNNSNNSALNNILMKNQSEQVTTLDTSKMKQAEDASRAFIPERKSIFDISAKKQAMQQAQTPVMQSSEDAVSLNQFMQNQSQSMKNRMATQQYQNENASMFAPALAVSKLDGMKNAEMNNQNTDVIQNAMSSNQNSTMLEQMDLSGGEQSFDGNESLPMQQIQTKAPIAMAAGAKVFDMSTLQNAENANEVINQIQNYIIQSKASNQQSVQMTFNHAELGNIDLQVMKAGGDNINIFINAQTAEGAKFFQQTQGELLQNLQQSGLQVAEFKLDSSSSSNNSQTNQDSSKQFNGQERQHAGHEQNKRENESEKRQELWQYLQREREMA